MGSAPILTDDDGKFPDVIVIILPCEQKLDWIP